MYILSTITLPNNIRQGEITGAYQWDSDVYIELKGLASDTQAHFTNGTESTARVITPVNNRFFMIPNVFLRESSTITMYVTDVDSKGIKTVYTYNIPVTSRPKPSDYIDPVDPPFGSLTQRVDELEHDLKTHEVDATNKFTLLVNEQVLIEANIDRIEAEQTDLQNDVYTKVEVNTLFNEKADVNTVDAGLSDRYTKAETDNKLNLKADVNTVDEGLSDRYTKTETDGLLAGIDTQLAEIENVIPLIKASENLANQILKKIEKPENFNWTRFPINIYRKSDGAIWTDLQVEDYKPVLTGQTYYVSVTGNNSNDGLTPETALRSIYMARFKTDVAEIIVYDGIYEDQNGFNNVPPEAPSSLKNLIVRAAEGNENVVISTRRSLKFTKSSDYANIYQTNRTLVARIYDSDFLTEWGDMVKFDQVADLLTCDDTPGSYYYDGTTLYIHRLDSSAPPSGKIFVFLDLYNYASSGDYVHYFENIKFWGGKDGAVSITLTSGTQNPLIVAKNCEFKYSNLGAGGLKLVGGDAILENCKASSNYADGFNYHHGGGRKNNVIEVNCKGFGNGIGRGTGTDNGSTLHDGGKIIRVNGDYYKNEGPNVHDIDENTQSWNIDCVAHESVAVSPLRQSNFRIETLGEMWLDNCKGFGSAGQLRATHGTKMYLRGGEYLDGTDTSYDNIMTY